MPENDPFVLRMLEKLGFNMTKLRWKLYKLEQRRDRLKEGGVMPERFRWLKFGNKICRHCGALNDRDAGECCRCERRLPSLLGYRIGRLFGFMVPESAPRAIGVFGALCVFLFVANILLDGLGAAFSPKGDALYLLGGLYVDGATGQFAWWRAMTFGLVHSGIFHILFNGYAMMVLSSMTEVRLGARRTLVLITGSQLGAAFATWFWYFRMSGEGVYTVGASGWVSGLLGYAIVYTWSLGAAGEVYRRQLTQWAIYILLFGFFMGANNMGHIGGAIGGAMVGFVANRRGRTSPTEARAWDAAFWVSAVLWAASIVAQGVYFAQHIGVYGRVPLM
jgi:rhomboid protease GluP